MYVCVPTVIVHVYIYYSVRGRIYLFMCIQISHAYVREECYIHVYACIHCNNVRASVKTINEMKCSLHAILEVNIHISLHVSCVRACMLRCVVLYCVVLCCVV